MDHLRNMGFEPDEGFLQEVLQRLTQIVRELDRAFGLRWPGPAKTTV